MHIPTWLVAGLWGLFAGGALVIGAVTGFYLKVSTRVIASVMAFGSGVLISALSFDLMDEAYHQGGMYSAAVGFLTGSALFTGINYFISKKGARHRKRSGNQQLKEAQSGGSGVALAVGALIDGIPESIVIGLSMLEGGTVSVVAVIAIFLSNIPEGLSSASGMKNAGRSVFFILGIWIAIAIISGISAIAGYVFFLKIYLLILLQQVLP